MLYWWSAIHIRVIFLTVLLFVKSVNELLACVYITCILRNTRYSVLSIYAQRKSIDVSDSHMLPAMICHEHIQLHSTHSTRHSSDSTRHSGDSTRHSSDSTRHSGDSTAAQHRQHAAQHRQHAAQRRQRRQHSSAASTARGAASTARGTAATARGTRSTAVTAHGTAVTAHGKVTVFTELMSAVVKRSFIQCKLHSIVRDAELCQQNVDHLLRRWQTTHTDTHTHTHIHRFLSGCKEIENYTSQLSWTSHNLTTPLTYTNITSLPQKYYNTHPHNAYPHVSHRLVH